MIPAKMILGKYFPVISLRKQHLVPARNIRSIRVVVLIPTAESGIQRN